MNLQSFWAGIPPRRMKTVVAGLLVAALSSSVSRALPPQENADKIIARVRTTYEKLEALSADFQKDYTWALAGETQTMTGKLYLKKGDRYRIETEAQTI
ncbi:hypothetical protein DCC62_05895, partial [candidate division KSB1 bacterium]